MNSQQKTPTTDFKITGNWETQSRELKQKFSQLTDSDLHCETGKEHEMLQRVETRLNKNREEVINILEKVQKEKM